MAFYTDKVNGVWQRLVAIATSAGVADADKLIATNANGELDSSFLPPGLGAETYTGGVANEALSAGELVNILDDGGVSKIIKADATVTNKTADGFVLQPYAINDAVTVHLPGQKITGLTGLTIGANYFLNTTAGGITTDVSAFVAGNVVQCIGTAADASTILFAPQEKVELT